MKRILIFAVMLMSVLPALSDDFNGGATVPVHRFVPIDKDGEKVSVLDRMPAAMSQVKTCSQCHDTGKMDGGSHFRTGGGGDAENKVNREPWFLCSSNAACRTVSVSDRGGLTAWEWTKMFARAFPGGGLGEVGEAMDENAGERQRWFVTGKLEKNCLACHSQDDYDVSEWAKQTLRENWSAAALAAAGFARVEGMNARLNAAWDGYVKENPDDHLYNVPENVIYDKTKFDDKGRCLFRVGKPRNENCLSCHAVAEVGRSSHSITRDVHLQRGMKCVDCHRNDMSHRMETKSCRSCHMEKGGEGPRPEHVGIPLVHFKKLSCAVCHSGVTEGGKVAQIRTARANRIGIYGKAQWATDVPFMEEPFVRKNQQGTVELCRRAALEGSNFVYWAFSHDVKPARMARGSAPGRCAECHSLESGFFDGYESPVYFSAFNMMFMGRPLFKVVLWIVFGVLCLFAAGAAALAVNKVSEKVASSTRHFLWGAFKWLVDVGFVAACLYLTVSGAIGWMTGAMTWWWLVLHMVAGGVLAAAVVAIAILRHGERTRASVSAVVWMLWIVFAAGTVFTAVMPMMTVFGSHGQEFLLWAHRCTAFSFVAVSIAVCWLSRRRRK